MMKHEESDIDHLMELSIEHTLQRGVAAHKSQGKLQEAFLVCIQTNFL